MFPLPGLLPAKPRHRFLALVALPAVCFAGALVLFGLWSLWITAQKSDMATRDRQVREVHLALGATLDELAQGQSGVAIWDQAINQLDKPKLDLDWLDVNVGIWLNYVFNHDMDVIVDGKNRPVYVMVNGVRAKGDAYMRIMPDIMPLIRAARGQSDLAPNPHERLAHRKANPESTVRTSPAAVHATDLARVSGRPAAVSVMRMIPDSDYSKTPGAEPLLISIRYLNRGLMRDLQQERGIAGARITATHALPGGADYSVRMFSFRGQPIGYFTWRPEMEGKAILHSVLFEGGIALAALLGLLAALIAGVGRLMARDAKSIQELQEARLELQAKEAQAQYLANHDSLTGLRNRASFNKFVDEIIGQASGGAGLAVMLIDLDRFKNVNDTLGHLAGDRLIKAVAERLVGCFGKQNIVARLGGDEFAICVLSCADTERLSWLAQSALGELRKPFDILGSTVHVGGSIGIALCPSQGIDRTELLRKADIAMYRAKEGGRDGFRFFSVEMDESITNRRVAERELRAALGTNEELFVAYQPKLDASGTQVVGLEALVRWDHPTRGELAPDAFIPVAEDCGLIDAIGARVLREACRVARQWPGLSMALNISPIQFRTPGAARAIQALVQEAGVDPRQIELEVTEGILIEDNAYVREALHDLRAAGFRIALDDFGTGYSSLSYLKKFKVDRIKIDKSFVTRLGRDPDAIAIVQAVITLGHAMALSVTAEGVETEEQGHLLRVAGCNEMQGFLYSAALSESELGGLLKQTGKLRAYRRSGPRRPGAASRHHSPAADARGSRDPM